MSEGPTHDPARSAARRRIPTGIIQKTRFVVGIDLGTTNTALAYVDRQAGRLARSVRNFEVAQLTDPGAVRALRTLPSAVYLRGAHDLSDAQVAVPWTVEGAPSPVVVGALARGRGAAQPERLITSAKSWLCHPGVDRRGAILPWGAPDDVPRRSPVEVEAEVLRHVRGAWDHAFGRDDERKRLEKADVVVTLPASFDEVARELTVEAVRAAGLQDALLIEEPTAALYAWIAEHEDDWPTVLAPGQTVLVCDTGGGTTDFSLIRVTRHPPGVTPGEPSADEQVEPPGFERVAVGEHLLLGGDNMDLALARRVEERLERKLEVREWTGLVQACRDAKERLLEGETETAQIALAGRGAKVLAAQTLRAELSKAEVVDAIVDGFFPRIAPDEPAPKRRGGLRELGLPYEVDPAITRHLRRFLVRHGPGGKAPAQVDHVLFNGGVFKTAALRARVLDVIGSWQERPRELDAVDLDLAVARGAAYYGLVRRGKGTRIRSGASRSYYVELRTQGPERRALCLVPRGLDEGAVVEVKEHLLEVQGNTPVVFPFLGATGRSDPAGALVPVDPDAMDELAPLHTVIRVGKKKNERSIPVAIVSRYTELGTLEVWLQEKEGERRWRLELDTRAQVDGASGASGAAVRDPSQSARDATRADASSSARLHAVDRELPPGALASGGGAAPVDPERVERARKHLALAFRRPSTDAARAMEGLPKELEELLGTGRELWPVPAIRALFDALQDEQAARKRSAQHEARWLNLAGLCLRPGFGATLDFDRVGALWKVFLEGPAHPTKEPVLLEWLVAFRRIAGGLNRGQQETLYARLRGRLLGHDKGASRQELAELWRLAASLEHLAPKVKRQLGDALCDQLEKGKAPPRWGPWALGRLGGRAPLYGPLDRLVPPDAAALWLGRLLPLGLTGEEVVFAMIQLARRTGDRARDVPDDVRARARAALEALGAGPRQLRPLDEVVTTELRTESDFYGDSVPIGLVLASE